MVFRVMKVLAKKTDSLKWFITSVLIKVKKATVWLPSPKFDCSISKLGGSAFELLFQKLSYWYCSTTLCAEHEWNCWNAKGVLLPNHKDFIRAVTKMFPLTLVYSFQETQFWLKFEQSRNEARCWRKKIL